MAMLHGGLPRWTFESCNLAHLATHSSVGSPNGRLERNRVHNSRLGLTRMNDAPARTFQAGGKRFAVVHNREDGDAPRVCSVDRCSMWLKHLCCIDPKGEVKLWLQRRIAAQQHRQRSTNTRTRLRDCYTLPHILPTFIA